MIIVTGGAGFIGSNLVAALEEKGHRDIVICDSLGSDEKWRNISKREIRDLVRPTDLFMYMEMHKDEIEMVYHMGAISSTTERNSDDIMFTNFVLSRELWRWCAENDVRFLYASSYSVYGAGASEIGFKDDNDPDQMAKLKPLNPYGWSKNTFDRRVARVTQSKDKMEKIPPQWVGLRLFNVFGPNEYHKGDQMSVVSKLYPQVEAGAAARLFKSYNDKYEDGGQVRDFIWIDDCIDVMLWFLENKDKTGIYNVGTGKGRSFKDLAVSVFAACGKEPKVSFVDMPENLKDKYQYFTEADITRLREAGYDKEFMSLEDGVKKYIEAYLSQDDPYR